MKDLTPALPTTPDSSDHGHGDHGHGDHGHGDHGHGDHGHGDHGHRGGIVGVLQDIFRPHSHDSADQVDDALEASSRGIRALKISLVALMITAVLQTVVVIVTGSVALLADTVHNFADALTAVPLWIAFVLARRLPTPRFTYGYRKAEDLAGLFILLMIAGSAVFALYEAIDRLLNPRELTHIPVLIAAGFIGFIGNELVAVYRIRVGKQIGSAALVADGYHARTDGLTSLAVVVGAGGAALGFKLADPIVGILITIAILGVLKGAAQQVFSRLMDAVDPALTARAEDAAAQQPGVRRVSSVRLRWLGHTMEAEAHIVVDPMLTTLQGHAIAEAVRAGIFKAVPRMVDVTVHVDPDHVLNVHKSTAEHLPAVPRILEPRAADRLTADATP